MALNTTRGLSGKKLSEPTDNKYSFEKDDDLSKKRDDAKKMALEKTKARTLAKQQQASERIATAAEQLSSGIQEGSGAAEELNKSMEQIASGAEEASGASEESRAAVNQIEKNAQVNMDAASDSLKRVNNIVTLIKATTTDIEALITGVNTAADTSIQTAKLMVELEKQSEEIGNIVQAVVRIADQTNLLALNAAIEAARAGEHGVGFAVVADEVRNLAETSEKSARDIKDVISEIQSSVRETVNDINEIGKKAKDESDKGKAITSQLLSIASNMDVFQKQASQSSDGVIEILKDAKEFLKMAESVAAASEQLASSSEEARKGSEQQIKAYAEMASAAEELAATSEELKNSTDITKSAVELASMAEELSANVEESSSAGEELSEAILQIQKASEIQSKDTERGTEISMKLASLAIQVEGNITEMSRLQTAVSTELETNKVEIDKFISNVGKAADDNLDAAKNIRVLDEKARKIDKIVESIMNVTIQTNMLAVSGSIEAARAGEHGKGFSVVANDIRTLANESAANADKIKDLVSGLQQRILKSAQDVEFAGTTAAQQVVNTKKSTANLLLVEKDMNDIAKSMEAMEKNSKESQKAIEQAKKGVEQISSAANEASNAAIQSASAAEEQAKGLQELSQAVEEIAALADELQNN